MSMGKRRDRSSQEPLWVAGSDLPRSAGHPFYSRLSGILDAAGFDEHAESCCAEYYAERMGRPSLPPGRYFRLLLLGYFEGLDSERGIAWRAQDSLSVRRFLGLGLSESAPDHSTISRTRRRLSVEAHRKVFTWVLSLLADSGLLSGKTLGVDATTLEANAALRSIVRRDTEADYETFLTGLAEASGVETPTRSALVRFDRKRKGKKLSNADWENPHDPDAEITKMKDGRTHFAYKSEEAVDLESGAVVGVTVHGGATGDTDSVQETLEEALEQVEAVVGSAESVAELVADKGYHSNQVLADVAELGLRSYIAEPNRGRRRWKGKGHFQKLVYGNRRRIRGKRGKRMQRRRGERVERPFAHQYETGGMRRLHLRGLSNVLKRLYVQAAASNLGLLMRTRYGFGTPRGFQGRNLAAVQALSGHIDAARRLLAAFWRQYPKLVATNPSRPELAMASCA